MAAEAEVEWLNGGIVQAAGLRDAPKGLDLPEMFALAQAMASGQEGGSVALIGSTEESREELQAVAGEREVTGWLPSMRNTAADARICLAGPRSVSRLGRHGLLHVEAIRQLPLAKDGVLALWLGAGTTSPDAIAAALATLAAADMRFHVFVRGREAVVIAGRALPMLDLARLRRAFRNARTARQMTAAGLAHPTDLLACYVGNSSDLEPLWAGTGPLRAWAPRPGVRLARDLSAPIRPASLLMLVQYRGLGAARVTQMLPESVDESAARVLLHNFSALYDTRTRADLLRIGRAVQQGGDRARARLLRVLDGERTRLDLMVPQYDSPAVQRAAVLHVMALHGTAIQVLSEQIEEGGDSVEARLLLGLQHERRHEWNEALEQYKKTLRTDPDNEAAQKRMERVEDQLRPAPRDPLSRGGSR
jgi:hypothetical protein